MSGIYKAMKVPFVNYPEQYKRYRNELNWAFEKVMRKGDFILREDVEEFENNMCDYLSVNHCIGVNSGTDALLFSLLASGIGKGDEVITVAHTFLATVGAIVNCGAKPVLIDIGQDYNMDTTLIEPAITERTKAIIPVHLNGRMCDMRNIMGIASNYNLVVIEDACQSLGAMYNGKHAGSYGIGCWSFYPAKMLGCPGDGGMVSTNKLSIANKVRWLRDNGRLKGESKVMGYGFNSRLDNLQAALLNTKLLHLCDWINKRREIAWQYERDLVEIDHRIKLPPIVFEAPYYWDVYQNYVIRVIERDDLRKHLTKCGIETLVSWPIPLHKQPKLGLKFNLPVTDQISREVISLPMYPELEAEQVEYVCDCIKEFYNG